MLFTTLMFDKRSNDDQIIGVNYFPFFSPINVIACNITNYLIRRQSERYIKK